MDNPTLRCRVELVRDPPDRTIIGVNRRIWDALTRNPRCRFAPPGGRLGQRILVCLELDQLPSPQSRIVEEGPAPTVSRAVPARQDAIARSLMPPGVPETSTSSPPNSFVGSPASVTFGNEVDAPRDSVASIGRLLTYAVLRDVPGDANTIWVSQEWLEDNKVPMSTLFPDHAERLRTGQLPEGSCSLSATGFVELAEVILECPADDGLNGPAAYELASQDNSKHLIKALKSSLLPLLRQKSVVVVGLPLPNAPATGNAGEDETPCLDVKLNVLMCSPTMQGVVGEKTTVILVKQPAVPPAISTPGDGPAESQLYTRESAIHVVDHVNGSLSVPDDDWDSASVDSNDTAAWLETLAPSFAQPTGERDVNVEGLSVPVPLNPNSEALADLHKAPLRSKTFTAISLSRPYPAAALHPPLEAQDDVCGIILVDWRQMASARWGHVVSGDWVLVRSSGPEGGPESGRMVRIFGIEIPPAVKAYWQKALPSADGLPSLCWMSPLLHHNLRTQGSGSGPFSITVAAVPSPYNRQLPVEAADVLLTRIASPSLNDRDVLDAALNGMKLWFEEETRVLRCGDFIGIAVDPVEARLKAKAVEPTGKLLSLGSGRAESTASAMEVVFFKVVNVKPPMQGTIQYGDSFVVNPLKTTMTESGVEHSIAPAGVHGYLSGKRPLEDLSSMDSHSPARLLVSLISTTLLPSAPGLNLSLTLLLHGPKGVGKRHLIKQCCAATQVNYAEVNCFDLAGDSEAKTESNLRDKWKSWEAACPVVVVLRNLEALSKMDKGEEVAGKQPHLATVFTELFKRLPQIQVEHNLCPLIVIGTTSDPEKLPRAVRGCFRHETRIDAPDEEQRRSILYEVTTGTPLAPDVRLETLALQTAALNARDLRDTVGRAAFEALNRAGTQLSQSDGSGSGSDAAAKEQDILAAGVCLTAKDFEIALERSRKEHADSIGAPKIPSVTWDDVGGLAGVKSQIMDTIQLPLEHPELFAGGMKKRSGILLYGPPGTGKTLLAKAVATEFTLNFLSVKGPELLNMYIGESEANVRKVFQRARDARPCVIFFDELDSVAPKRGDKGDSGGVMDRIVSQLLAELDGMSSAGGSGKGDVFVIGATNRPDLLDPALLRPGRFDKLLYLGVSKDHDSQLKIIEALTRKFRLHPDLDLQKVADKCPFNYTGADFYALCSDAMLKAMVRKISEVDKKIEDMNKEGPKEGLPYPITASYFLDNLATPADYLVEVQEVDFDASQNELVPSVPMAELDRYERIRERFEAAAAADEAKKKGEIVEEVVDLDDVE